MMKNKVVFILVVGVFLSLTFDNVPCRNARSVAYRYYDMKGNVKEIREYVYEVESSEKSLENILSQNPIAQSVTTFTPEGNLEKIYQLTGKGQIQSVQIFRFKDGCLQKEEMYNAKEELIYNVTLKEVPIEKEYRLVYTNPKGIQYSFYDVKLNDSYQISELVRTDTTGFILSSVQKTYDVNGRLITEKEWLGDYYIEMKVEYLKSDAQGNWINRYHITNKSERRLLLHREILYYKRSEFSKKNNIE